MDYCVIDLETSIKNRGENAIGNFKASPHNPMNKIVLAGGIQGNRYYYSNRYKVFVMNPSTILVGANFKFDMLYLMRDAKGFKDWIKTGQIWDVQQVHYLLSGQTKHYPSLNEMAEFYGLEQKPDKIKEYWDNDVDTEDIPREELEEYLKHDVITTESIFLRQVELVMEKGMINLVRTQMDALIATMEMEYNGMYFDKGNAQFDAELLENAWNRHRDILNSFIWGAFPVGYSASVSSNKDLATYLYGGTVKVKVDTAMLDENGEPIVFKTGAKKGQVKTRKEYVDVPVGGLGIAKFNGDSVDEETLKDIKVLHPSHAHFINSVLDYRTSAKDISTYYKPYIALTWPTDSCIHPTFNMCGTNTGRLSSSSPNMQNVSGK